MQVQGRTSYAGATNSSMTLPATIAYPGSTSALWQTCWGAPASFLVSLRQQSPHYSTKLQGRLASWKRLSRYAAGPGRLYEVNMWMWCYCRGSIRMVSITETEMIRRECISETSTRAAETSRKRRSEAAAAAGAAKGGQRAQQSTCHDIISDIIFNIIHSLDYDIMLDIIPLIS